MNTGMASRAARPASGSRNSFRNTPPVEPPKKPEQGYHLTEDMTDDAISWIKREKSIAPDKPFFIYFATGATRAPLHAPKEWIDKFKGKFDQGWDKVPRGDPGPSKEDRRRSAEYAN